MSDSRQREQKQRKYEVIWEKLKKDLACNVQVNSIIVARVIKAVVKEKYNDTVFKMANDVDPPVLATKVIKLADRKHSRIEFRLRPRYGIVDVKTNVTVEDILL